ncbi:arylsulfatase [Stieleria sp. TO1_6]|uniref:sulfatase family protein n=1 Tax=Stieleria tagensis TaxID=2956795 RepID=UPI00209B53B8|nr:arylsulfatase [Stieleria tagensis]MCO8121165.1 arylsulfatase [Stieleria tagensis]
MIQIFASMQAGCRRSLQCDLRHQIVTPVLVAVAALVVQWFESPILSADSGEHPNIVLILVDDMGYGDPGCFNANSKIATPNIDSLATDGMRFTDAHAPGPLCHMSRYGLMTGRYPFRINVNRWPTEALIQPGEVTVASLLRDVGYRTAMVGKWHVGFNEDGYDKPLDGGPADRGFGSFFGIRASTDIPPYFYIRDRMAVSPPTDTITANQSEGWSPIQGAFWRAGGIAPNLQLADVLPRFADEACQVIESHAGRPEPLMLYVAFPAPHTPWLPGEEYAGKSGAGMYGDFAMMVDAMVGRILKQLDDSKLADDTLVIFTSDNGPVWYESDVQRFDHDSSGGLRGMKADAWECGHRMPMVARWPGTVQAGSTCEKTISFVDFLATFDELVGADVYQDAAESDVGPDSFSFAAELTGKPSSSRARPSLAMKSGRGFMTIRRGDWKLIEGDGSGGFSDRGKKPGKDGRHVGQLYQLADDIGETNNLIDKHPQIVESLRSELAAIMAAKRSRDLTD